MPVFESALPLTGLAQGDVVKLPFPYTDRATRQSRPALVLAAAELQRAHGLLWVLMITSAANRGWPGDIEIVDLDAAGLPVPSIVRTAKIATIKAADATRLGSVQTSVLRRILGRIGGQLGLA